MTPRILLVDDIEMNRVVTEAVLRAATYAVDSVADGTEALRALDATTYDLVLMDLDMPGLDGYATAAIIRRDDGAAQRRRPHVVALTARTSAEARARSRDVGMADHIARPISPRDLIREVGRLIAMPCDDRACAWRKETFAALVAHLGATRMRMSLRMFREQCEIMLATIACENVSPTDIARKAHDLVSVGGMLGFEELSRLCFELQAGADTTPPRVLSGLERALRAAIGALGRDGDDAIAAA